MKTKNFMSIILICSFLQAERIPVTQSVAITKAIKIKEHTGDRCEEQQVKIQIPCQKQSNTNEIGLDTVIGGVIGVAIGNQIGSGSGRDVAKVIGGLAGMQVANNNRNSNCYAYDTNTKCYPTYGYKNIQKTVGYNNCAYYMGKKVCKRSNNPLNYLNVSFKILVH